MKQLLTALLFTFLANFAFGQTNSIVGAWFWRDDSTQTSMFFKADGSMSMHSGPKGGIILTKNLKAGKYVLKNNLLVISWTDKTVENDKLKFLDKNTFQLTITHKAKTNKKRIFVFRKVVDEEVIEDK